MGSCRLNGSATASRTCLKCGHVRRPTDVAPPEACPACGAIYAKVEAHRSGLYEVRRRAGTSAGQGDGEYVDAERRRLAHLVYFLYLLPAGLTTLLGYSIARASGDDHADEIAFAHTDWQVETVSRVFYLVIAALALAALLAGVYAVHALLHNEALLGFARILSGFLLVVAGGTYLWVAVRSVQGWIQLVRGEGP